MILIVVLMKKMIERISGWRIWRLSGGRAFLIMIACWFGLGWVLGPISNTAYRLSILLSFFGPTALFCFIFARHWFLRAESPKRDGLARRVGCIIACGITTWFAIETALSYASMDDAPRGLVWDFNVVIAPLFGAGALLLTRVVVHPSTVFKKKEHNQALHGTAGGRADASPDIP
jgi:hypothetical protein